MIRSGRQSTFRNMHPRINRLGIPQSPPHHRDVPTTTRHTIRIPRNVHPGGSVGKNVLPPFAPAGAARIVAYAVVFSRYRGQAGEFVEKAVEVKSGEYAHGIGAGMGGGDGAGEGLGVAERVGLVGEYNHRAAPVRRLLLAIVTIVVFGGRRRRRRMPMVVESSVLAGSDRIDGRGSSEATQRHILAQYPGVGETPQQQRIVPLLGRFFVASLFPSEGGRRRRVLDGCAYGEVPVPFVIVFVWFGADVVQGGVWRAAVGLRWEGGGGIERAAVRIEGSAGCGRVR